MRFEDSEDVMRFVSGEVVPIDRLPDVLAQGAATPDHILNTKRTPLWIDLGEPGSGV
jgi:rhamnose utilization protein RhaD (predicted bifunctional aldolase and dehydrogenase)